MWHDTHWHARTHSTHTDTADRDKPGGHMIIETDFNYGRRAHRSRGWSVSHMHTRTHTHTHIASRTHTHSHTHIAYVTHWQDTHWHMHTHTHRDTDTACRSRHWHWWSELKLTPASSPKYWEGGQSHTHTLHTHACTHGVRARRGTTLSQAVTD